MPHWFQPPPDADESVARPARRPVVALGLLALGYALARYAPFASSAGLFALASFTLLIALFGRGALCRLSLAVTIFLGGAGWFTSCINERPHDSLWWSMDHDPLAEPAVIRLVGMIETAPRDLPAPSGSGRHFKPARARATVFDLSVRSVAVGDGAAPASGRVRVHLDGPSPSIPPIVRPGSFIQLTGRLRPAGPPANPGEPPRDLLAAQQGRVGTLIVPSPELVQPSAAESVWDRGRGALIRLREALRTGVLHTLGDADQTDESNARGRALVRAMLLGETDPALDEVESAFRRVGLVHLVAISGFNLALLVWITLLAIRLTGDRGWLEPALGAGAVLIYLLILPGESSIQRAGLTLLAFTAADSRGRRYDRLTLLACVAIVLLLIRPMDLWSLGFQLSFGVVGALLGLGHRVHARLWGPEIRGLTPTPRQRTWWWIAGSWIADAIKAQISATLLAWAAAAPLIALHTGVFTPLAPIASIVILPITIVLLALGYTAMLLGLVIPSAAAIAGLLLDRIGEATVWLVTRIDEWPGATVHLPRLSAPWAALATVCILYWLGWGWKRDPRAWGLTAATLAWLALLCTIDTRAPAGAALRIDTLACGDGECHLVRTRTPSGASHAMLVNAGASGAHPDAEDLARAVRALGAWRVRTVLITDPHVQSWSELPGLIAPLGIRTVLLPQSLVDAARLDPTGPHARLLAVLQDRAINARVLEAGDRFALGPAAVATMIGEPGDSARTLLPRVRIETPAGPRSMLIAGSARYAQLDALAGRDRHADVLVVPGTLRASDRPADAARSLGASVLIHAGTPSHARDLLSRLGPLDAAARLTADGPHAVWAQIAPDGTVRLGP